MHPHAAARSLTALGMMAFALGAGGTLAQAPATPGDSRAEGGRGGSVVLASMNRPAPARSSADADPILTLIRSGRYKTLISLLVAADLLDGLRKDREFTLFAPDDDAFARLPESDLNALLAPEGKAKLREILAYHVVDEKTLPEDLVGGARTLSGERVTVARNQRGIAVNDATVKKFTNLANRYAIYEIDRVLTPLGPDVVAVAEKAGFTALLDALKKANLTDALRSDGPFTVFAPTNEAFATLAEKDLAKLAETPDGLAKLLKFHVVPGKITREELLASKSPIETLAGETLPVNRDPHAPRVGGAKIVKADIAARNGIVHVVDKVLARPKPDLVAAAEAAGRFKTLVAALKTADLDGALRGQGPFTVFAPTDEAFAKLGGATLKDLLKPENKSKLAEILQYHVVKGKVTAREVIANGRARTLQGGRVTADIADGRLTVNGVPVIATDLNAANGIIHVLDAVLIPPAK